MTLGTAVMLIALCLLLQGFFSGTEMALVSSNRALLKAKASEGNSGAALAIEMLEVREERLLATCLIGTNLFLIAGTTVTALVLLDHGRHHEWLVTLLYVPLALIFGEAVPKTVYRHFSDALAPVLARPIRTIETVLSPALWIVSRWNAFLKRTLRSEEPSIRREDIVQLLDDRHGHRINPEERAMIRQLLAMNEVTAEDRMTPLVDVHAVPSDATVDEAIALVIQEGHSRVPVYRERIDNLVGRIEHRALLFAPPTAATVESLMLPVRFVPNTKRGDELLREMREASDPFAVVVDEYGGSIGIVTMEDLLEHVVGEIDDERDMLAPGIRRLSEREWRVPARTEVAELEEALGRALPSGDYETVAGLLLAVTGKIPVTGEAIRVGRLTFHVEAASDRAVHMLRVVAPPVAEG
jgi:CBS domain containing-hemolysin-like protein